MANTLPVIDIEKFKTLSSSKSSSSSGLGGFFSRLFSKIDTSLFPNENKTEQDYFDKVAEKSFEYQTKKKDNQTFSNYVKETDTEPTNKGGFDWAGLLGVIGGVATTIITAKQAKNLPDQTENEDDFSKAIEIERLKFEAEKLKLEEENKRKNRMYGLGLIALVTILLGAFFVYINRKKTLPTVAV